MSSAVSLFNHTFTGQALSSKRFTSIVHILSPETALLESAEGKELPQKIFRDQISTKECCRPNVGEGSNPNILITSRLRIQLGHRGRLICKYEILTKANYNPTQFI